jgi:hypothetical protein
MILTGPMGSSKTDCVGGQEYCSAGAGVRTCILPVVLCCSTTYESQCSRPARKKLYMSILSSLTVLCFSQSQMRRNDEYLIIASGGTQ